MSKHKLRFTFFLSLFFLVSGIRGFDVAVDFKGVEYGQDQQGQTRLKSFVGDVFTLVITVHNAQDHSDELDVPGLGDFRIVNRQEARSVSMYNGTVSATETTMLDISPTKQGHFKIGPVVATAGGKTAQSAAFYCDVEATQSPAAQRAAAARQQRAAGLEVELIPSKKELYWGEQLELTLRYISSDRIYQLQPELPEQTNFLSKGIENKGLRNMLRNGQQVSVYEQVLTLQPIKPGVATIGPMKVHYTTQARNSRYTSTFDRLFGPQLEQRELDVASLDVVVKPLPKTNKKVLVVGDLRELVLTVDKPTAQVNDPIKLTVAVKGKGNLDILEDFPLELPAGFKTYKARSAMHQLPGNSGLTTKEIEFVLQVNKSGQVIIPAQSLTYFDPNSEAYKTVTSEPIELFLTGDVVEQPKKSIDELAREANEDEPKKHTQGAELAYIFEDVGGGWGALPWWAVLLLMLLPLLVHVQGLLALVDEKIIRRFKRAPTTGQIIAGAKKELATIAKADNAALLHQFFIKTLASLWQLHEQEVTELMIEQRLLEQGWQEERLRDFISFISLCASLHFTRSGSNKEIQAFLLKKAEYWLLLLDGKQR